MNGRSKGRIKLRVWLPLIFFAVSTVGIGVVWWNHQVDERERIELETEIMAEQMRFRLEAWIQDRAATVIHTAQAMSFHSVIEPETFRDEAEHLLDLFSGFQALNYVDVDGVIAVTVPEAPNVGALGKSLAAHPDPDVPASFARACTTGRLTRTRPIPLLQGGRGLATYVPIVSETDGAVTGYVNGVFRIDTLVRSCLAEDSVFERFDVHLTEPDRTPVFDSVVRDVPACGEICAHQVVRVVDRPWILHLSPSTAAATSTHAKLDTLLGLLAVVLSGIAAMTIYYWLSSWEKLGESRANYRLIVENQQDVVVKASRDHRVLFVSPSFREAFGMDESELLGKNFLPLVHPDDLETGLVNFASVLEPPYAVTHENRLKTRDGWRWFSIADKAVLGDDGEVDFVVSTCRDVTARKELEDQLLQSQKLQAVGELAGGVAHDFNNILQSIMGSLEFAIEDTEPGTQVHGDVVQARRSAEKAAGLTRQLLAFSRRQVIQPANILVDDVIDDSRGLVERALGDHVNAAYDLNGGGFVIRADVTQIQQVLLNLCVNARDAIEGTGSISISTEAVVLDDAYCADRAWAREGEFVRLSVIDDGCGMDPDVRDQIFEPFFTTKKKDGGTGLGLSTVYGIVQQHGGLLDVRSRPGEGTAFHLYFERVRGEADASANEPSARAEGGHETLLLAEDDEAVRSFAVRVLEEAGYEVLQARDGREAAELFDDRRDDVDAALLDVMMPQMGGREVRDRIHDAAPDVPVLFCSAYDAETIHTRFILDEGLDLLPKPYDRESLLTRVRGLLDVSRAATSSRNV